jgi:ABC-type branched-subunit amino acid transport system substrate-binding protein
MVRKRVQRGDREGADGVGSGPGAGPTRRDVLAGAGAAGLAGLAGCLPDGGGGTATQTTSSNYANVPLSGDTVKIGVSVPQTGVYQGEGQQLRFGYELAAQNINNSDVETRLGYVNNEHFAALQGSAGLRGKQIELVVQDTESSAETARSSASTLIEDEGVVMLAGGASSDEAMAHQSVAMDNGVVHMIGFAPGNSISGTNCALTGFQEMFNAKEAAQALRPVLTEEYADGADVGESFAASMRTELADAGWSEQTVETTRVGTTNFRSAIETAVAEEPDVLVLNYYGLGGSHALRQAADIADEAVSVVVPLYNRPMARNAGGAMADVLGTIHWESSILERYSRMFTNAWRRAYSGNDQRATAPSGLAHLAYSQLFQYAAAVERAGTFEPPAVVDELEDFTYDIGMGEETMRQCDHTAQRSVPIVRGLAADDQYWGRYYEIEEIVTPEGYTCDEAPAANCNLGSF